MEQSSTLQPFTDRVNEDAAQAGHEKHGVVQPSSTQPSASPAGEDTTLRSRAAANARCICADATPSNIGTTTEASQRDKFMYVVNAKVAAEFMRGAGFNKARGSFASGGHLEKCACRAHAQQHVEDVHPTSCRQPSRTDPLSHRVDAHRYAHCAVRTQVTCEWSSLRAKAHRKVSERGVWVKASLRGEAK